jgi:hypothetical protein
MRMVALSVVVALAAGYSIAACSSSGGTQTVSFKSQVLPTFQTSCGIAGSTCHGTGLDPSSGRPFLGDADGGTDPSKVLPGIIGVKATEDPQLSIVKPSDPSNSYMMHKLDGDQMQFAAECATADPMYATCGQRMPYAAPMLDQATIDMIRQWIAQGAQNN